METRCTVHDAMRPAPVAPSPEVLQAMREEFQALIAGAPLSLRPHIRLGEFEPRGPGFSDGVIYPPGEVPERVLRLAPAAPAGAPLGPGPVRGVVNILVALVQFPDLSFSVDPAYYRSLLFSSGTFPTGSLRDYYTQASYGKVLIDGTIIGPYTLPQPYRFYTGERSGMGEYPNNAQRMTEDALELIDPDVDFSRFDPNGDGYVDALVIVHAGPGAESIPTADRIHHIWSHKWVLSQKQSRDGVNLYAYLTVPEDGRLGVWAHELGHLLFQWPDLYDTDYSSSGLGNWCLMAGGSWNNGGRTPALPCAWCRMSQGWTDTAVITGQERIAIPRASEYQRIYKLWTDGLPQTEYFLLENRARHGFDAYLPGEGLLIYHVDETQSSNAKEPHYKVALMQADGLMELETKADSGDAGDPFPGSTNNRTFDDASNPSSRSHAGAPTFVAVREISDAGIIMTALVDVRSAAVPAGPPAPQEPAAARSVTEVPGIGAVRARRLAEAGIGDLAALAGSDAGQVAGILGVSQETAAGFIAAARWLISQ